MNRPKYPRTQSSKQPASSRGFLVMCVALLASFLMPTLASAQLNNTQSTPITIRDSNLPPTTANPYPSIIDVSGVTGRLQRVNVTLTGLSHTYPDDIDIMLVAPGGQSVVLMSDAGLDGDINGVNLTFQHGSPTLPDSGQIIGGTYGPSDYTDVPPDVFPGAPVTVSGSLDAMTASSPNGQWRLFIVDDAFIESGSLTSWTLSLETTPIVIVTNAATTIEDTAVTVPLTLIDSSDNVADIVLTGTSGNQNVIQNAGVTFGGSGANRTVTLTPRANSNGVATVTVNVNDGTTTVSTNITLTVISVNDAPTFTQIPAAVTTTQGLLSTNVIVRVADVDTAVNNLTFSVTSSDSNVVTGATVFFAPGVSGSGTNFMTVAPVGAATGTATLTITVTDAGASNATSTATVNVTVLPARHVVFGNPAAIATVNGDTVESSVTVSNVAGNIGKLTVVLADVNHPNPEDLNVLLVGPRGQRVILMGEAGGANPVNRARVTFDQADPDEVPDSGQITTTTYNPADYAAGDLPGGPTGTFSVTLDAFNNTDPNGTWTLHVSDAAGNGTGTIAGGFVLNIFPTPNVPDIADQFTAEDTPFTVTFPVTDIDNAISNVTVVSLNQALVTTTTNATLSIIGGVTNASITITPVLNAFGTNVDVMRVVAQDVTGNLFTNFFTVGVRAANDAPTVSAIQRQVTRSGVPVEGVAFTVADTETAAADLTVTATSSNQGLLPNGNIILGGSGANRTVSLFPIRTAPGTARVTITVSDGTASSTSEFDFVVIEAGNPLFENSNAITINDGAAATPYPSTITVAGLVTNAAEVRVTLFGITHPNPNDIDVLLVGPQGQEVMLMSDAGGATDLNNVHLVFADAATNQLTDEGAITSGTYDPADFGAAESLQAPAPPAPYSLTLSAFTGTNPNGTWSLFVRDDATAERGGQIAGGWQLSIRTRPVITPIAAQTTEEDVPRRVTVVIGDEQPGVPMSLTATSSNQTLVANAGLEFSGTGANRTLTVTPVLNASGTNHITVFATDPDGVTSSNTFVFIITPLSDAPLISPIADQSTPAGIQTTNIAFTVQDPESPATDITVTATSSDQTLVPDANITLTGTGTNRTISILPSGVRTGTAEITITARDPSGQRSTESFILTVAQNLSFANAGRITINDATPFPPTPSAATPYPSTITVNGVGGQLSRITVTVVGYNHGFPDDVDMLLVSPDNSRSVMLMSDAGGSTAASNLRLTFSDNAGQPVPDSDALVSGQYRPADYEAIETMASPAPGRPYSTTLSSFAGISPNGDWKLYIMDDTFSQAGSIDGGWFIIIETAPTINDLADQVTPEDTALPVRFVVSDADTDPTNLTVTATATAIEGHPLLTTNLVVSGSTLTITPTANLSGTNLIRITVSDGTTSDFTEFRFAVTPVNDAPLVTTATNRVFTAEDIARTINFDISDIDSILRGTNVTVTSSDPSVVPNTTNSIAITAPASTAIGSTGVVSVVVTSATNASGTTVLSFVITDGSTTTTNLVNFTVDPVNDLPTLSTIEPQNVIGGQTTTNIAFRVTDVETSARNLTVTATSGNQARVPNANIVLGGSAEDRTITITTVGTTPETVRITMVVTDQQGASVTNGFDLNIGAAPGAIFVDTGTILIPGTGTSGDASPYPSDITVSGQAGDIHRVFVTLEGFSHSNPDDVDVLLVSPSGQKVLLMSDAGGTADVSNLRLRFADTASALPDETPLTSGDFRPTDYGPADTFGGSAPAGPYAGTLAAFAGSNPNGTWNLFIVDDAGGQTGQIVQGWTLTIETAPTIVLGSSVPRVFDEDTTDTISFTIGDQVTPAGQLQLIASSDNPRLLPNANVTFDRTGSNNIVATIRPAANESGTNNLTITVRRADGATDSIVIPMNVRPVNDAPLISRLLPVSMAADATTNITFFVIDVDTGNTNLAILASSSNPAIIPNSGEGLRFFDTGTNRLLQLPSNEVLLTIDPLVTANGQSIISITVTDRFDGTIVSSNFTVDVFPRNIAPTITAISSPQFVTSGDSTTNIAFSVADPDSGNLTVTGTSSDQSLVPNGNIVITPPSGPGGNRTVRITALPNVQGTTRITLTVTDNHPNDPRTASTSFDLVVRPSAETILNNTNRIVIRDNDNALPYPSVINVSGLGGSVGKVEVTLNDFAHRFPDDTDILLVGPSGQRILLMSDAGGGGNVTNVDLTFDDSAAAAIPDSGPLPGDGASGTFLVSNYEGNNDAFDNPAPNGPYTATSLAGAFNGTNPNGDWSLYIMDDFPSDSGFVNGGWSLAITIQPSIVGLEDRVATEDEVVREAFSIATASFAASNFTFTATTTNAAVVTTNGIRFEGSGTNWTVVVTPVLNATGVTEIAVMVTDAAGQTATDSFLVTFNAFNDAPTISAVPDQTIQAGSSTPPITFNFSDAETENKDLILTILSSNEALIPTNNIQIVGNTLTITPVGNMSGESQITIRVADPQGASAETRFLVRVIQRPGLFANTNDIVIRDTNTALPYPSTITVSNVLGNIGKVTVILPAASHSFPDDIDMLLVGPQGQKVLLWSDAGGDPDLSRVRVVFDDAAAGTLPNNGPITNGIYRPTDFPGTPDTFPAPAPAAPYANALNAFNGTNPNGTWSLYIVDTANPDSGLLSGGWLLDITTTSPTIAAIPNQNMLEDTPRTVDVHISDSDTPVANLVVTATTDNTNLLSLSVSGTGSPRSLTITPAPNAFGTNASVTVSVSDGTSTNSTTFIVNVQAVGDAPTVTGLPTGDQTTPANRPFTVPFTISDAETASSNLTVNGSVSNPALGSVTTGGTNNNRTITYTPTGAIGTNLVTVIVSDGVQSVTNTFAVITTTPVNTAPTISGLNNINLVAGTSQTNTFTVNDAESGATNVTTTASVSNASLGSVSVSGTGGTRTLIYTATATQGTNTIIVTASDGSLSTTNTITAVSTQQSQPPIAARLAITNVGPNTVQVSIVQGSSNATYRIESSTDLRTFTPLTSITTDATGRGTITVPKTGLMQVFRAVGEAGGSPTVTALTETGGDNETTDTIPAKMTGQTFVGGIANEPINGYRTNDAYTVGFFGFEAPAFVDRNHQWEGANTNAVRTMPTYLLGGEYIMTGQDNRDNPAHQLVMTLSRQADVYMLIDNRLGDANSTNGPSFTTNMTWVVTEGWSTVTNGFNRTSAAGLADEVGIDEGADGTINQWSTVYWKRFPAGTVTLRQADNGGQNMYGVVIRRIP